MIPISKKTLYKKFENMPEAYRTEYMSSISDYDNNHYCILTDDYIRIRERWKNYPNEIPPQWQDQHGANIRDKVNYTMEQWPLAARTVAKLRKPPDKGIGDTLHRNLSMFGGATAFKMICKMRFGKDCGCGNPHWGQRCLFVCGMHVDEDSDRVMLSGGDNDQAVFIADLRLSSILQNLVRVITL